MKSPPKGRGGKDWPLLKLGSGPTEPEQGPCASSHRVLSGPIVGDSVSSFHSVLRIHVCICEYMCVHVLTFPCAYLCAHAHVCTFTYVHVCTFLCVPMLVLECVHTYECVRLVHVCLCLCIHVAYMCVI